MNTSPKPIPSDGIEPTVPEPVPAESSGASVVTQPHTDNPNENRRWWIKLLVQPALILLVGVSLIVGLGIAQRSGFLVANHGEGGGAEATARADVRFICPMMCTPPQSVPGRCPVCAMELVEATTASAEGDERGVRIDPAARRIANIQTVAVQATPMHRTVRAIGKLSYDEGKLKTISAYVDGRLERLFADYTGVVVRKEDQLALVYSPRLYSAQVELLLAKRARDQSRESTRQRTVIDNQGLYESATQRLLELGMTESQIQQLERDGEATSRMHLCAPISGTVIEKLAVEGQYVKEGQPIYKLADLSTVWLTLELFPEDASAVRYGQRVQAEVQSLPGQTFSGRIAFVDPNVDPATRTVGVRVVMENSRGLLRVGDYAKATIEVALSGAGDWDAPIYDPELARKWISPRHPHVIESGPGTCRECGVPLVPSSEFGFSDDPTAASHALTVPRNSILMAGTNSVVYVEVEPGYFEMRRVVLGPNCNDQVVILSGLEVGDRVATHGNFLIDSQMQLAGKPSLIDPNKAGPLSPDAPTAEVIAALAELSPDDRKLAEAQRLCPVAETVLGSMGPPQKVDVAGTSVFICCEACRQRLLDEPERYLAKLTTVHAGEAAEIMRPSDLPPIGLPQLIEPMDDLPPIETPRPIEGMDDLPPIQSPREIIDPTNDAAVPAEQLPTHVVQEHQEELR